MRVQSQPAFLLHSRPFRETSLIIEVFTRHFGRTGLLARGVRNPKSRKRALVMPFQPLLIGWTGKGELPLLTGIESTGHARELSAEKRYAGFYLNELLMKLLHRHDAHEALFDSYSQVLEELYQDRPVQLTLRKFEKEILGDSGYGLILHHEAGSTKPVRAGTHYTYIPELGPVPVSGKTYQSMGGRQGIAIRGKSLLAFHHNQFTDRESMQECRKLVRFLLDQQMAGKPLYSRRVFHQVISNLN